MSYGSQVSKFPSIHSGNEAQLNGELSRDFTSSCRDELLDILDQRPPPDDIDAILPPLLVSTDEEIVLQALRNLASRARSHHLVLDEKTSMMVRELSRGWPPLDLLSSVTGDSQYHLETEDGEGSSSSCLDSFNRRVREAQVPADSESRFGLLTRIRYSRAFSSTETRHAYVKIMMLAMQVQWEKQVMPGQLKKLVKSGKQQIPGSIRLLALETLTAYGRRVFSPADRQRKVDEFLSGKTWAEDAGFVEAMVRNGGTFSAPLIIRGHHDHCQIPAFLVSSACADNVLTWLEKELIREDVGAAEEKVVESLLLSRELLQIDAEQVKLRDRLQRCLLELFRRREVFGARLLQRAAALFTPGQSELADSAFVDAMLSAGNQVWGWQQGGEGEEKEAMAGFFFSQLTPEAETEMIRLLLASESELERILNRDSLLLRHALQSQPRFTSSLLEQLMLMRLEPPAGKINHLGSMIRLGGGNFVKELGLHAHKVVALFEAAAWPLSDVCCFSVLGELLLSGFSRINLLLDSALGFHKDHFLIKLAVAAAADKFPGSHSLMLAAWRHPGMDQRRRLHLLLAPGALTASLRLEDVELVPGLASKVLEMLRRSTSTSATTSELLLLLTHILELVDQGGRGDNIFESPGQQREQQYYRGVRAEALAWYSTSLAQPGRATPELLKLGEVLTRDNDLDEEVLFHSMAFKIHSFQTDVRFQMTLECFLNRQPLAGCNLDRWILPSYCK